MSNTRTPRPGHFLALAFDAIAQATPRGGITIPTLAERLSVSPHSAGSLVNTLLAQSRVTELAPGDEARPRYIVKSLVAPYDTLTPLELEYTRALKSFRALPTVPPTRVPALLVWQPVGVFNDTVVEKALYFDATLYRVSNRWGHCAPQVFIEGEINAQ